jgi:hypothetical protein
MDRKGLCDVFAMDARGLGVTIPARTELQLPTH